jgi:hypothetical protein
VCGGGVGGGPLLGSAALSPLWFRLVAADAAGWSCAPTTSVSTRPGEALAARRRFFPKRSKQAENSYQIQMIEALEKFFAARQEKS